MKENITFIKKNLFFSFFFCNFAADFLCALCARKRMAVKKLNKLYNEKGLQFYYRSVHALLGDFL